jgi:hypothetical protein
MCAYDGLCIHHLCVQAYEVAKDEEGHVEATMLRIVLMRIWWYAWYAWHVSCSRLAHLQQPYCAAALLKN